MKIDSLKQQKFHDFSLIALRNIKLFKKSSKKCNLSRTKFLFNRSKFSISLNQNGDRKIVYFDKNKAKYFINNYLILRPTYNESINKQTVLLHHYDSNEKLRHIITHNVSMPYFTKKYQPCNF